MQYLMLTVAVLLLSCDFIINKLYQRRAGTSVVAGLRFNALLGAFTVGIFFFLNGCRVSFTLFSFLLAATMNLLIVCYNLLGFRLLQTGAVARYTTFLMMGGMILPYLFGLLFLEEPFSPLRTVGIVLLLIGIALSGSSTARADRWSLLLCVAVFVLNGAVSILSKLHQIETGYACVNASEFVLLGGFFKLILAGTLFFVLRRHPGAPAQPHTKKSAYPLLLIAASALASGLSFQLQLLGASSLPATVLYPFVSGGSIVFSALAGRIVFGERLAGRALVSVIFCFCGTILFL